ncbi:hypothetical protein [Arenimonas sp.]|jgi:hypothetical protein|uniref:hypothetical protein n=1 Tax=Arenimonas sp. TaxID=1872635 RepID=UPI0037BF338C
MAKKARMYTGSGWVDIASSTTDLSNYANMTNTPISGFRNAIINGDFRINQRGITSTGVTTGGYFLDRWRMDGSTGTITASVQSFTPGNSISGYEPTQHSRISVTGQSLTTAYATTSQKIEDVRTFAGQTIVISFWAKAASGTPKVGVEATQDFGTGGSTAVLTFAGNATISTSWARYSFSVTLPSISGKTIGTDNELQIGIWLSAGATYDSRSGSIGIQNNTFDFWGVQVESGTIATPFEQRPIGTELALCQRYFQRLGEPSLRGVFASTTLANRLGMQLPVQMRIPPRAANGGSLTINGSIPLYDGGATGTFTAFTTNYSTNQSIEFDATAATGTFTIGRPAIVYKVNSSANFIDLSAEL